MEKNKICYKVVSKSLQSCLAFGKARVEYKLNKWVEAPEWLRIRGNHLFCFKGFRAARLFCKQTEGLRIYRAEYKDKVEIPEMVWFDNLSIGICDVSRGVWMFPSPKGTMCVKKLKLIKRVK